MYSPWRALGTGIVVAKFAGDSVRDFRTFERLGGAGFVCCECWLGVLKTEISCRQLYLNRRICDQFVVVFQSWIPCDGVRLFERNPPGCAGDSNLDRFVLRRVVHAIRQR